MLAALWGRGLAGRIAAAVSIAWLAVGTIAVHPHEIAYANEAAGGPRALWTKRSDSNVDWGQALPDLAERVAREPLRRLYLGYFGTADPAAYGLRYHTVPSMRMIPRRFEDGPDSQGKEWVAISVTNLLGVYTGGPEGYAWLRSAP